MDRTRRSLAPTDPQDPGLDRKLHCLCSWLERASQRESHAVHASLILPIGALTIGATLAAALLGVDAFRFAMSLMTLSLVFANIGFLVQRRRCQIWGDVARRLQKEQRLLIDPQRHEEWAMTGRVPPDRLADALARETPVRLFTIEALGLYLAALMITVMFALFALSADAGSGDLSRRAPLAPVAGERSGKPVF